MSLDHYSCKNIKTAKMQTSKYKNIHEEQRIWIKYLISEGRLLYLCYTHWQESVPKSLFIFPDIPVAFSKKIFLYYLYYALLLSIVAVTMLLILNIAFTLTELHVIVPPVFYILYLLLYQ